ncbi:MAG: YggS family pyridoxal phosphate enzyme [Acidimicrobiales bacterium]
MTRLEAVRARIGAAGADPAAVTVVAVTKGFGPDALAEARSAGLEDFGENYAQELLAKAATPEGEGVRWHFLGSLQRNKAARLSRHVAVWEAIDRPAAAAAVAGHQPGGAIFVEVQPDALSSRPGCPRGEVASLVERCDALGLEVRGLMGVAPGGDNQRARGFFRQLHELAAAIGLHELSMGMSDDYELAVAEGATVIRLGRALFGPRQVLNRDRARR